MADDVGWGPRGSQACAQRVRMMEADRDGKESRNRATWFQGADRDGEGVPQRGQRVQSASRKDTGEKNNSFLAETLSKSWFYGSSTLPTPELIDRWDHCEGKVDLIWVWIVFQIIRSL
jgi:hypothetical protein